MHMELFRKIKDKNKKKLSLKHHFEAKVIALKISCIYVFVGSLWILFSDGILHIIEKDAAMLSMYQVFKGWFYVIITAIMLYLLIYNMIYQKLIYEKKLLQTYEEFEITQEELVCTENDLERQIYELQKSQQALKESEERFRLAMEGANDGIWDWDISKNSLLFTRTKKMLGYEECEIKNSMEGLRSIMHADDIEGHIEELEAHTKKETPYYEFQYRLRTKNGKYRWILSRGKAIFNKDGKAVRISGSHRDVTDYNIAVQKIYDLAYYDSLTGISNRATFKESLYDALMKANEDHKKVGLLYMDLDNFKMVNDTLGHMFGDELLKNVAKLLKEIVSNKGIVARLGGDEFAIVIPQVEYNDDLIEIAKKIIESFQKPWIMNDRELYITSSIGICVYPNHAKNTYEMVKNADTAMYSAKEAGKNNYRFYEEEMNKILLEKIEMKNNLRKAIEREEFVVYYQPQIDINSGEIIGVEALLRWIHPTLGLIPPNKFIPIAEESDLIMLIDEWVLRAACKQSVKWVEAGYSPFNIAVNLSARQLQEKNLVKLVRDTLKETGMNPHFLELEITESVAMKDLNITLEILKELKKFGVKIALDDFGTGYSSLNYLKLLPIDTLKIDKTFVDDIMSCNREQKIIQAVINLAHTMNLTVTAEGIETEDQLLTLKDLKCNEAQGYYFSKPIEAQDLENLLKG